MTISIIESSLIQVLFVSVIALIIWLIFFRRKQTFLKWIGLHVPKINNKARFFTLFIMGYILFSALGLIILIYFTNQSDVATSQFYGVGISGILGALLYAFVQTGLSEEILFRGLIGKRAISAFGFGVGNTVQALLFGSLHGVIFFAISGMINAIIITLFTAVIGWVMGYLNEKLAAGSIIPSWMLHGFSNLFSSLLMMFEIL